MHIYLGHNTDNGISWCSPVLDNSHCCDNGHLLGCLINKVRANIQLPYKACFEGAQFKRRWDQLMYGSRMLLRETHTLMPPGITEH